MALSPNYGWAEPDNSSLVKNGAQDIRALGDAIDTSVWNVGYGQAGKNKIINGDFTINQRSFTTDTIGNYGFDRWIYNSSGATGTYSAQTFTAGAAPVAGYEATNFARLAITTGNDFARLTQRIESVRTFAGQTVTLSFWAKGTNPTTAGNLAATFFQNFGTGGSTEVALTQQTFILTANWTRYSLTFAVPSISGKTIGTGSFLGVGIGQITNASTDSWTLDIWGVQVEYGSKATPFQTATGTIQGELAACQRYYYRYTAESLYAYIAPSGVAATTTIARAFLYLPVTQRTTTQSFLASSVGIRQISNDTLYTSGTFVLDSTQSNLVVIKYTHGSAVFTAGNYCILTANNSTSAYVEVSAEL
jgi:hypothetical protein